MADGCDSVSSEMPKGYPRTRCRICGGLIADVGTLSKRGKCARCGLERMTRNAVGLSLREGPEYLHWKRRNYMAALRLVLEDQTQER